jgi:hypothetical protein
MVQLLLGSGANPAAVNDGGQVPIDGALDSEAISKVFHQHSGTTDCVEDTMASAGDATAIQAQAGRADEHSAAADLAGEVEDMSLQ